VGSGRVRERELSARAQNQLSSRQQDYDSPLGFAVGGVAIFTDYFQKKLDVEMHEGERSEEAIRLYRGRVEAAQPVDSVKSLSSNRGG